MIPLPLALLYAKSKLAIILRPRTPSRRLWRTLRLCTGTPPFCYDNTFLRLIESSDSLELVGLGKRDADNPRLTKGRPLYKGIRAYRIVRIDGRTVSIGPPPQTAVCPVFHSFIYVSLLHICLTRSFDRGRLLSTRLTRRNRHWGKLSTVLPPAVGYGVRRYSRTRGFAE